MRSYIQKISTALPQFVTSQDKIADFMVNHLHLTSEEEKSLRILYRASGIKQRYSVLEDFGKNLNGKSFFKEDAVFPRAGLRMRLYQDEAIGLAGDACKDVFKKSKIAASEITHLITISCTGMYAPGLDIDLIERLQLNSDVKRTSINFMGCYAAFIGFKTADQIIKSEESAKVLMVAVELCTLHLQQKKDEDNLLANSIFADGAASLIISGEPNPGSYEITDFYSDLALSGKKEMGWYIGDFGFEMKLSSRVPGVIKEGIGDLTSRLLEKIELSLDDIAYYAIHPGGKRILEVIEEALGISKEKNAYAREVLKACGNMSSPTVLFVLKLIMDDLKQEDNGKNLLSFAFGPGLTLESTVLKIHF